MHPRHFRLFTTAGILAATTSILAAAGTATGKVREPAVAGLFYPRDSAVLSRTIESFVAAAKSERTGPLKALVCPHAGYSYSGPVAASGFRLLRGTQVKTVVLLAPSHYAALRAASVSDASVFRTPLGDVPISPKAQILARNAPFALEPPCVVERPEWASQSSRPIPPRSLERADTWEHSDEVEVPFLQQTLGRFELLPVVCGEIDVAAAARALAPLLDDETVMVVSSDLSHYHPYAEARRRDQECIQAILALDVDRMAREEACGRIPILTLMHVAKQRGWKPVLLDYRNSGDTSGDKSRVVGYAAIAWYGPAAETATNEGKLSASDRRTLLELARRTVRDVVAGRGVPEVPVVGPASRLSAPGACFVTLMKNGDLRGCIGHLQAVMPLGQAVVDNARNAAVRDPRFRPVTPREVDQLEIEISLLSEPRPLAFSSPDDLLAKLQPGRDGVVLQLGNRSATYLPQVWEQIREKTAFLDSLAEKAGARPGDWRRRGTTVLTYRVESFKESAP